MTKIASFHFGKQQFYHAQNPNNHAAANRAVQHFEIFFASFRDVMFACFGCVLRDFVCNQLRTFIDQFAHIVFHAIVLHQTEKKRNAFGSFIFIRIQN